MCYHSALRPAQVFSVFGKHHDKADEKEHHTKEMEEKKEEKKEEAK